MSFSVASPLLTLPFVSCSTESSDDGGEIIFGGVDENLYTGDIYWTSVTQELYWQIGLEE
jgi:gastricsin